MSAEDKIREASNLLHEAEEETKCKSCKRKLKKLQSIASKLADTTPYAEETAEQVEKMTEEELKDVGGKVNVLYNTVLRARKVVEGNATSVRKSLNSHNPDYSSRGISMVVSKGTAINSIVGSVGIGTFGGYVLDKVCDAYMPSLAGFRTATVAKLLVGAGLEILAVKKMKGDKLPIYAATGGATLMAMAASELLNTYVGGYGPRAYPRYASARAPGQLPMRTMVVEQTRSY